MFDIIILNHIGSFKVDIDNTSFCFETHFLPQNSPNPDTFIRSLCLYLTINFLILICFKTLEVETFFETKQRMRRKVGCVL